MHSLTYPLIGILSLNASHRVATAPPSPSRNRFAMCTDPRKLYAHVLDNDHRSNEDVVKPTQIALTQGLGQDRVGGRLRHQHRQQPPLDARTPLSS